MDKQMDDRGLEVRTAVLGKGYVESAMTPASFSG